MPKTDKELAVELMSSYLQALYTRSDIKTLTEESIQAMLEAFYKAVKKVTE